MFTWCSEKWPKNKNNSFIIDFHLMSSSWDLSLNGILSIRWSQCSWLIAIDQFKRKRGTAVSSCEIRKVSWQSCNLCHILHQTTSVMIDHLLPSLNWSSWLNCDNMAATSPISVRDSVCYLCTSLKDSVVLRCSHSLCRSCLQSYWELNKSLECPVCLRETHCSVLLHHLSISHFSSEDETSQDSNFKPLHVGNVESEMVSELHFH